MRTKLTREILEQHHSDACRWAMSCCDYNRDRALEVMQMVYLEILEGKAVYGGKSSLRTWLFGVVRNMARRQTRKLMLFELRHSSMADQDDPLGGEQDAGEKAEEVTRVWSAIRKLSVQQRQVIELVYYRDFSLAEVAQIMGISLGSVRQQFHRAKQKLASALEQEQ